VETRGIFWDAMICVVGCVHFLDLGLDLVRGCCLCFDIDLLETGLVPKTEIENKYEMKVGKTKVRGAVTLPSMSWP